MPNIPSLARPGIEGIFVMRSRQMSAKNGLPCKNCGGIDWTKDGKCRKCKSERDRLYRNSNPEKVRARKKKYRDENPEKVRVGYRRWIENNRDRVREVSRVWANNNRDRLKDNHARWMAKPENKIKTSEYRKQKRIDRKDAERLYARRWREQNRDRSIAACHRHRAKKKGGGGSYTQKEWMALVAATGNKCLCCGRSDVKLTADHIIPVSLGGSSYIDNIQPLCQGCNSRKGARTIDYRENGMYKQLSFLSGTVL